MDDQAIRGVLLASEACDISLGAWPGQGYQYSYPEDCWSSGHLNLVLGICFNPPRPVFEQCFFPDTEGKTREKPYERGLEVEYEVGFALTIILCTLDMVK